ncbi:hypothetical protein AGMMS49938_04660 [Fibrobacterales bacterium]|nr:hypothetical protein AGMMS49938_04660 [Fibrobacterales bacterium]
MRFFPKFPDNLGFWRKWNVFCVMFIGSCLLATRFYQNNSEVVEKAENLMWFGGAGLVLGFAMQVIKK